MTPRLRRYLLQAVPILVLMLAFNLLLLLFFRSSTWSWSGIFMTWSLFASVRWLFRADPEKTD